MDIPQSSVTNRLLTKMSAPDFALLAPHLAPVNFEKRDTLSHFGKAIKKSYFIEQGMASVVATTASGSQTEVGLIGREGMVDVMSILGGRRAALEVFIQAQGSGFVLPSIVVQEAIDTSVSLRHMLLAFAQSFLIQVSHTAVAAASLPIKGRLARWLIMCADRVGGDVIPMTHDFLSIMLNVRRPGVTGALNLLQREGAIQAGRGVVAILDRPALLTLAGDTYGEAEAVYSELLGPS